MIRFSCNVSPDSRLAATPLPHFWEQCVGSDHANITLRADWQSQLRRAQRELGFRCVRFHGLLDDDVGALVRVQDKLVYSFFNTDRIIDFLLSIGMRPFVELSFMPTAIASGDTTVFHYHGNVTPPRDYRQWAELIRRLLKHWVDRYGVKEVRNWFFEVWNEPNMSSFWSGTRDDYFKLYRVTAQTVKNVDDKLRVGGPATAQCKWIDEFLSFCERHDVPVDFVSTHHYPNDPPFDKDASETAAQLAHSRRSFMREQAQDVHRRARGLPVYFTEWSTSSDPHDSLHDQPYAAAFVVKTIMESAGLVSGYSHWTFTDVFEENYFPSTPYHGGFGLMNLYGVPKPAYRAFELLHRLGDELLVVDGMHRTIDVWVVRGKKALTVVLTNHALPFHEIEDERVLVELVGAPALRNSRVTRIDEEHANPRQLWKELGQPEYLSAAQVEHLKDASRLVDEKLNITRHKGRVEFELLLPPHSVAVATLSFR